MIMGKKKKKKQDNIDTSFMGFLESLEDSEVDREKRPIIAEEIRDRIRKGASVDDISDYKSDTLKAVLSYFRVSGRSKLTYKEDMAKRLIEVFGDGEDKHGKASRNEEEKLKHRQELDNLIIRNIRNKGGI